MVTNAPKILRSYFLVHASYPTPRGLMWASALYSTLGTQSDRYQIVILSFAEAEKEEEWKTIHPLSISSLLQPRRDTLFLLLFHWSQLVM